MAEFATVSKLKDCCKLDALEDEELYEELKEEEEGVGEGGGG